MAAPTQEYPPWLTPIPSVIVDSNGVPITTSTTILFLPLTYYGPSIPLGPDWTYGGLTSPASTSAIATPTPTTSLPITTAIPPTSTTFISASSTISSSSTSSTLRTASSISGTSLTSSSSSSSTPPPSPTQTSASSGAAGRLTRGQLVGVIVASILGFIFLLVLILAVYLFCKGRRRRQANQVSGAPNDDEYHFVEGSPRHSGEEADPFLSRRNPPGGGNVGQREMVQRNIGVGGVTQYTEMGARPPQPPPKNIPRVPPPPTTTLASQGSSNSSSSNSGYGEPLARPTLGIRPIREEHEQEMSGGMILTAEELQRIDQETVLPPNGEQHEEHNGDSDPYSGAYAYRAEVPFLHPPKLVDPSSRNSAEFTLPRPFTKKPSLASQRSSGLPVDADENATLLTARRVRVEDLVPRSSPGSSRATMMEEANTSKPSTSSFLGSLGAIAGRLSWRRSDSQPSPQQQPLLQSTPLSDQDLEQGRASLRPLPPIPQASDTVHSRGMSVGVGPDGSRPISSVSGKSQNSGGTIYHDALSSPATPTLTPPPRAATPSEVVLPVAVTLPLPTALRSRPSVPSQLSQSQTVDEPPMYEDQPPPGQAGSPSGANYAQDLLSGLDILDLPAPSALSIFATGGSNPSLQSDATIVDRSNAVTRPSILAYPFPPGLGLGLMPTPKAWSEISNGETPSPGSFGGGEYNDDDDDGGNGIGITIDVLEEEPPAAGEGWRSIAAAIGGSTSGGGISGGERLARRTTFGVPQFVHQPDFMSEQASLHSMRSHISPSSPPRSTGSAAASSRRDLSYGSGSSRPSAHSGIARSTGTGTDRSAAMSFAQSLTRSGSITSDGRRRGGGSGGGLFFNGGGPVSPALSAFGQNSLRSGSGSGSEFVGVSREGSGNGSVSEGVVLQSPDMAHLGPARGVAL